ncbi:elongation factor 4 [SAR202 cluster bacterium AD-802-E10_MRT_200m]|nr:elongation factor 4 [SAR202 cluster bacterium AD-802-E10_MRT_200m]
MDSSHIRNFCIIAHIDHGKSTLADRILELTETVSARHLTAQFLDQMELEKERGITIKGKAVRMLYQHKNGESYQLNLIDTPGHVDFSYEVSRALAACEGAILVVDATQGIQAQTIANAYLAMENDLTLIPVLNKIDLPVADPERVANELEQVFGFRKDELIYASAKDGAGVEQVMDAVIERLHPPKGDDEGSLRALIFDSAYDPYKGVIAYVRAFDGAVQTGDRLLMVGAKTAADALEIGAFRPNLESTGMLTMGEVGYIATGLKNVKDCTVGDTITLQSRPTTIPLPGYKPLKPMVFMGIYPAEGESYENLRDALDKLSLNDAALNYEPESSPALGFGFRAGFLGLLHLEIVQERLEREYDLSLIATAPSVSYQALLNSGEEVFIENPAALSNSGDVQEVREPWIELTIIIPSRYIGPIMDLATNKRGKYKRMEYLASSASTEELDNPANDARVLLEFQLPLAEVLVDFYHQLKSRTQGYASMDYNFIGYIPGQLVKLDILLNGNPVDALSSIVHKDLAYDRGRALVDQLRKLIPRQLFEVAVQAAIGSRVIARESIRPLRKDVLAKCYGGDVTRKRKLLQRQAEGKKRLKRVGQVEVPQEAFLALMTTGDR